MSDDDYSYPSFANEEDKQRQRYKTIVRRTCKIVIKSDDGLKSDHFIRQLPLTVYASGFMGCLIRDAVTGEPFDTRHKVGSRYEDLYFKIIIPGVQNTAGSNTFFFRSLDEYQRKLQTKLKHDEVLRLQEKYDLRTEKFMGSSM